MFRGLTRREHAIVLGMVACLTAASTFSWIRQQRDKHPVELRGPVLRGGSPEVAPRLEGESVSPSPAVESSRGIAALEGGRVDLNLADAALLEALPDLGPTKAAAIVDHRDANGPFSSVDDLVNVEGIGPKTLDKLRPVLFVAQATPAPTPVATPPPPTPTATPTPDPASTIVDLNAATLQELETLEGIGEAKARAILEYRVRNGRFGSIEELMKVEGIGPKTLEKNRHRLAAK